MSDNSDRSDNSGGSGGLALSVERKETKGKEIYCGFSTAPMSLFILLIIPQIIGDCPYLFSVSSEATQLRMAASQMPDAEDVDRNTC